MKIRLTIVGAVVGVFAGYFAALGIMLLSFDPKDTMGMPPIALLVMPAIVGMPMGMGVASWIGYRVGCWIDRRSERKESDEE